MKTFLREHCIGLVLGSVLVLAGCPATSGPAPPPGTPGIVNCSDAALHAAELKLLPSLENAVSLADFASAEAAIASVVATEALVVGGPLALAEATCAIQWIVSKAETAASVTADSLEAQKVVNGKAWLAKDGATVGL